MNSHFNLYNKYRPNCFQNLIGQDVICTILINSLKQGKLGQSYIFSGPRGTGKTSLARILAKGVNCLQFNDDVCNQCHNCHLINQKQTTDLIELDAASNNGVENIRDIINHVQYLPVNGQYKVYIIDEAHMLTNNAWNALLKIIEEPPQHVIFIFSTTEFSKIIPTIQSRCQKHHFFLLNENTITDQIIKVTALEKGAIDHLAAVKIAKLAQGSLRDALSLLGQIMIYANNKITLKDVENVLLLADQNSQISFLKALFTNNIEQVVTILQTVYFQGFKLEQFLTDLIAIIIDLLVYYHSHKVQLLQTIQLSQINDLSSIPTNLKQYLLHLETTINELKKGQNPLLITKLGVMKIIHLPSDQYWAINPQLNQPQIIANFQTKPNYSPFAQTIPQVADHPPSTPLLSAANDSLLPAFHHDEKLFQTNTIHVNNQQIAKKIKQLNNASPLTNSTNNSDFNLASDPIFHKDNLIKYGISHLNQAASRKLSADFDHKIKSIHQIPHKTDFQQQLIDFFTEYQPPTCLFSQQVVLVCFQEKHAVLTFNNQFMNEVAWGELQQIFGTNHYWVAIDKEQLDLLHKKKSTLKFEPFPPYQKVKIGEKYYQTVALLEKSSGEKK